MRVRRRHCAARRCRRSYTSTRQFSRCTRCRCSRSEPTRSRTAPLRRRREPRAAYWKPAAQQEVIRHLIEAGADPDAMDKSGVAPLHRAVRTRSSDRGQCAHRERCGSEADKQERFDPAAPCSSEHGQRWVWLGRGQERTTPDHRHSPGPRSAANRRRWEGQDGRGGGR